MILQSTTRTPNDKLRVVRREKGRFAGLYIAVNPYRPIDEVAVERAEKARSERPAQTTRAR